MALDPTITDALFKTGMKVLKDSIVPALGKKLSSLNISIDNEYGSHIKYSLEKCQKVRTILNRDRPIQLMDLYVGTKFKCGDKLYDDYSAIDEIRKNKRVLVTGTGGGGKTMFMKYLWCSLFESPRGSVPLFIELRNFNGPNKDSFISFIFRSVNTSKRGNINQFQKQVEQGLFSIILDGFDEISEEHKDACEQAILEFGARAPESIIVVSGRPDERFSGWTLFHELRVQPLDKTTVIKLINKLDFDIAIKRKFVSRIKKDLYERHSDFLSNPLLSTMMLLTFDQFADIPDKIHLFYDQAFHTLFSKHDATKEGFKRKTATGLSIDIFKSIISLFCLVSYHAQIYEFDDSSAIEIMKQALRLAKKKTKPDNLLKDMIESVCILQRDGLSLTFTHRSFQEFFCANALINVVPTEIKQLMPGVLAGRQSDNVLRMCWEMNRELIESNLVIPNLTSVCRRIESVKSKEPILRYMESACGYFVCRVDSKQISRLLPVSTDDEFLLFEHMYPLYGQLCQMYMSESTDERNNNHRVIESVIERNISERKIEQNILIDAPIPPFYIKLIVEGAPDYCPFEDGLPVISATLPDLNKTSLRKKSSLLIDAALFLNFHFRKKTKSKIKTIEQIFFKAK